MADAVQLAFHADALRILGVAPRLDPEAARVAAESVRGRTLPAAVQEWYSLEGAEELLTPPGGECGVVPLVALLRTVKRGLPWVEFYVPLAVNTGYQAYFLVAGPDDPPVKVDLDPGERPFSEYVRWLAEWRVNGPW